MTAVQNVRLQSAYRAVATGVRTKSSHIGPQNVPSIYTKKTFPRKLVARRV